MERIFAMGNTRGKRGSGNGSGRRGRPKKTCQEEMIYGSEEDYTPSPHKELFTIDPTSHPVQDSDSALKYPLHADLHTYVLRGKMGSSGHHVTPTDETMNVLEETEDALWCITEGEKVVVSESPLQENKVSGPLNEITKNLTSKSDSGSSIIRSKRSEDMQQSFPMDLFEDHVAQTEVNVASHSFNLTEVVANDDDDDGIESSIDPALVDVQGYRVRPDIAPLLHQILEQYGDITKDCNVKALRRSFLENVCYVYEKLERSSLQDIKRAELFEMGETIDELRQMGVNVKWLSERLTDILEAKVYLKVFAKKKKDFKKGIDQLVTLRKTMASIEQKQSVLEEEITKMKAEDGKVQKVRDLLNHSLVDGLIKPLSALQV